MDPVEPQSASDYDDRTTAAVKSVLVEIGQILGSFEGKFAVIGGAVPWLLLSQAEMPHVGTADVDLALHAEALGDGEYARLVELLQRQGYRQAPDLRRFQLARTVPARDDGPPIDVVVDFLMPRDAVIAKSNPPLVSNFAVQRADGADLALNFYQMVAIDGDMPDGGRNLVSIAVASIPALLAMKGYAIAKRQKQKDAYDIYYCVLNYPGGVDDLVLATLPLLKVDIARTGYRNIAGKFRTVDDYGPVCVRRFVHGSPLLGQADARSMAAGCFRPSRRLARPTWLEVTHAHHLAKTHPHNGHAGHRQRVRHGRRLRPGFLQPYVLAVLRRRARSRQRPTSLVCVTAVNACSQVAFLWPSACRASCWGAAPLVRERRQQGEVPAHLPAPGRSRDRVANAARVVGVPRN